MKSREIFLIRINFNIANCRATRASRAPPTQGNAQSEAQAETEQAQAKVDVAMREAFAIEADETFAEASVELSANVSIESSIQSQAVLENSG